MAEVISIKPKKLRTDRVLGYMGERQKGSNPEIVKKVEEIKNEFVHSVTGKVCFDIYDTVITDNGIRLLDCEIISEDLKELVKDSDKVVLMAATCGPEADRLRMRNSIKGALQELITDALGTEGIEEICDLFFEGIENEYGEVTRRFSPGYGDVKLDDQYKIFNLLNVNKTIGITLTDSLLMIPTKSVTALCGLKSKK